MEFFKIYRVSPKDAYWKNRADFHPLKVNVEGSPLLIPNVLSPGKDSYTTIETSGVCRLVVFHGDAKLIYGPLMRGSEGRGFYFHHVYVKEITPEAYAELLKTTYPHLGD